MRTFHLACAALAVALGAAATAQAAPNDRYIQVNFGAVLAGKFRADGDDVLLGPLAVRESLRQGWTAGLLVGDRIGAGPVSVEAEGLYLNDAIKSDDINAVLGVSAGLRTRSYAGLVNLKLEQPLASEVAGFRIAPYAAGGVGYGHNSITILGDHYEGGGFAWQAKAGLALHSTDRLAWDVGYSYLHLPTFDTNKLGLAARMRTGAHALTLGVRYAFGAS